jgi:hypothetical protein
MDSISGRSNDVPTVAVKLGNLDQFNLSMRTLVWERDTIVVGPRFYAQKAKNAVVLGKSQMNI